MGCLASWLAWRPVIGCGRELGIGVQTLQQRQINPRSEDEWVERMRWLPNPLRGLRGCHLSAWVALARKWSLHVEIEGREGCCQVSSGETESLGWSPRPQPAQPAQPELKRGRWRERCVWSGQEERGATRTQSASPDHLVCAASPPPLGLRVGSESWIQGWGAG